MPDLENTEPVNLDEVHEDGNGNDENNDECPDSPSGSHEYDTDEATSQERCVYCGEEKD